MECTCDRATDRFDRDCRVHVDCDNLSCRALMKPVTLEDYKLALEHWIDHSYLSGCSHAC